MLCFKKSEDNRKCSGRTWRRGLIALAFLLSVAVPLWAQDWVYIGGNYMGEWYLNRRSVEDHGSYVTGMVWVELSVAGKSSPSAQRLRYLSGREPSFLVNLYGAAKGSRQIRQFQLRMCDKNGSPITTLSAQKLEQMGGGQWKYCTPGAMEESVWKALMDAAGIRY